MFRLFRGVWLTGVRALRLPEDSCINEAHYVTHECVVLCSAGDEGDRPSDTVYHYSLIMPKKKKPHSSYSSVSFHNKYKQIENKNALLIYCVVILLVCYFINLWRLIKQHIPPWWWMCVGVKRVLLLPSKSWAYWGNPAALSQSHASFASISETQESVHIKNWRTINNILY